MKIAKLNDGRIVELLKDGEAVPFDNYRNRWSLVRHPLDKPVRKREMEWVKSHHIVWRMEISE